MASTTALAVGSYVHSLPLQKLLNALKYLRRKGMHIPGKALERSSGSCPMHQPPQKRITVFRAAAAMLCQAS